MEKILAQSTSLMRISARSLKANQRNTVMSIQGSGSPQNYSPYGFIRTDLATTLLAFAGQRLEVITGSYPLGNGYRTYHPGLMRFTQPDAFSPFGKGGLNGYGYCLGDPVNRVDLNGRWPSVPTWMKKPFNWLSERLFNSPHQPDIVLARNLDNDTTPYNQLVTTDSSSQSFNSGNPHWGATSLNYQQMQPPRPSRLRPLTTREKAQIAVAAPAYAGLSLWLSYEVATGIMYPANIHASQISTRYVVGMLAGILTETITLVPMVYAAARLLRRGPENNGTSRV
ncbi:RHS repeat-associated core domain-containing protein [Pseudomonas sp. NPDC089422]|uniref:RHS repeat-associated core domain-containing protein n=1 Tax=Pseudomonas sp. NPDC089422 TaxID=3364466 RepID=UPI003802D391